MKHHWLRIAALPALLLPAIFIAWSLHQSNAADSDKVEKAPTELDRQIDNNAQRSVTAGRQAFRFDTFGDEAFWGDTIKLHQSIAGAQLGGIGPGLSPKAALDAGLKVDVDALPSTLIESLKNGQVNLILFQTMDGYDASRVLLPTLHDRLREHLGSPFAAGIPNRDILLCFRDDEETVGRLAKQIAEDYQRMPHQVTDRLLLITQDGIAPRP